MIEHLKKFLHPIAKTAYNNGIICIQRRYIIMDCLFCGIIARRIPAKIVFENEVLLAFHDVNPQAPTHILIIPKQHIQNINHATSDDEALLGQLILAAKKIAADEGLTDAGYRLVFNTNEHGGQTVYHIHLHLLGGRQLTWPPG